jgi:hypothetical protein
LAATTRVPVPFAAPPNAKQSGSKSFVVEPQPKPNAALNVKANDAKQPLASNDEWIVNVWRNLLDPNPEDSNLESRLKNIESRIKKLKDDYGRHFEFNHAKPDHNSSAEYVLNYQQNARLYEQNVGSLDNIARSIKRREIRSEGLKQMRDLLPLIIEIEGGGVIASQLTPLKDRGEPKEISGQDDRCWLRSSWAAAVDALPEKQFIARVLELARSMREQEIFADGEPFGGLGLNFVDVAQIYLAIDADSENGLSTVGKHDDNVRPLKRSERLDSTPPGPMPLTDEDKMILERKQRALMIALVDADESVKTGDVKTRLDALKNGKNEQAEQQFIISFMQALDLPVIIHSTSVAGTDIRLPKNFNVAEHGHPDTWPTIYHTGGSEHGHYQFYPKRKAA